MKHIKNLLSRMWKSFNLQQRHAFSYHYLHKEYVVANQLFDVYQANASHIKALLELERDVYEETPWEKSAFLHEFMSALPHLYLCIFTKERLVAFGGIRVFQQDGHITNIIVAKQAQSSGLGTIIMEELEGFARNQHCQSLSLEVRKSNLDAQRFYRRLGFVTTIVKPNYYEREDALEMRKAV